MRGTAKRWISWVLVLTPLVGVAVASDLRLVEAVKNHKKDAVAELLRQRADMNSTQGDGSTALHWAAHWDEIDTADLLIRAGANVKRRDGPGSNAALLSLRKWKRDHGR